MFTANDIKPGMAVVLRNGDKCIVIPAEDGELLCVRTNPKTEAAADFPVAMQIRGSELSFIPEEDEDTFDIMEVWDGVDSCIQDVFKIPKSRDLLWHREPARKMTLSQIVKLLGFAVKIVPEEKK